MRIQDVIQLSAFLQMASFVVAQDDAANQEDTVVQEDSTTQEKPEEPETSDDEVDHVHYIDPALDGSCTACVGARRIYCLDGGREDE